MKKHLFLLTIATLITIMQGRAQSYNTAAGVRFGDDLGISIAQRISDKHTIQLIHQGAIFNNAPQTQAYFVRHRPLITNRFNFFLGGGAFYRPEIQADDYSQSVGYGPTGMIGVDLSINRLNIAVDWSPTYNLADENNTFDASSAITLRYVLYKRPKKVNTLKSKIQDKFKNKKG